MKDCRMIFPAHYRIEDDEIQTLEDHLINVMEKSKSYAGLINFSCTGCLIGILHDLGKYTDEFSEYMFKAIRREKAGEPKVKSDLDHGKYGAMLVLDRYHNGVSYKKALAEIIAMVICYHHGGLEDYISDNLDIKILTRCGWTEEDRRVDRTYQTAKNRFYERVKKPEELDDLFEKAVEEFHGFCESIIKTTNDSSYYIQLLIKFLYSCLIDADRYDTYLFAKNRKENDVKNRKALWVQFRSRLGLLEKNFRNMEVSNVSAAKIKRLRQELWQQCNDFSFKEPGIYTLTVPTGGGKTLSSLRYALNHAIQFNKIRIIYVLPFTSIIEQNAAVVREALEAGDFLLEHHSNVVDYRERDSEEIEYRELLTEQWTSPIIFTTMVQFLNTFFAGGTKNIRRFHNLTDTILIFDEIQALPIKCISLFNEAINFLHSQCRDTIILCSATQPELGNVKHAINIKGEIIQDVNLKFEAFKRMNIIDARGKGKISVQKLGEFIQALKANEKSILIILNTKGTAEAVYREVKNRFKERSGNEQILFYHLSTNLCSDHRKYLIGQMKSALKEGKEIICVSTQLIEAGVDISFSCVVRHLAGLDSIAQASGRGNRNGEGDIKNTYIIELEEENLGSLDYIKLGEISTASVLNEYEREKDGFHHDLLSPKAIHRYYSYLFSENDIENKMDYPAGGSTIYNMLSRTNKRHAYKEATNQICPIGFEYQFGKAGDSFTVIDEFAETVLVPYEDGKEIIQQLQSQYKPDMDLIRKAQPYMVNISKGMMQKLKEKNAVNMEEKSGIWILEEYNYDIELGVTIEGRKREALFIGEKREN